MVGGEKYVRDFGVENLGAVASFHSISGVYHSGGGRVISLWAAWMGNNAYSGDSVSGGENGALTRGRACWAGLGKNDARDDEESTTDGGVTSS